MWIFTKWGFFSVTQTTQRKDEIQIRARARQHLQNLKDAFPTLERNPIVETPDADYRFRIILKRWKWEVLGDQLTRSIDYSNFKGEVQRAGFARGMLDELHRIWSIMFQFQRRTHPHDPMAGQPKLFAEAGDPLLADEDFDFQQADIPHPSSKGGYIPEEVNGETRRRRRKPQSRN